MQQQLLLQQRPVLTVVVQLNCQCKARFRYDETLPRMEIANTVDKDDRQATKIYAWRQTMGQLQ
jgi:hypothetical protein